MKEKKSRGGTHQQHADAGKQSHKTTPSKQQSQTGAERGSKQMSDDSNRGSSDKPSRKMK